MKDKHLGTILVFVIVFVILFLVTRNINMLYIGLGFGAIGLFIPWLSRHIHTLWMKFAELLGSVMSKVILVLVFYVFLLPVSLLSKLFRKSPFKHRDVRLNTYYTDRNFTYTPQSLEQSW